MAPPSCNNLGLDITLPIMAILQAIKVGCHRYDKVIEHCLVQATASRWGGSSTASKRTCQRTAQGHKEAEPAPGVLVLACAVPEDTEDGPHDKMGGAIDLNLVLAGSHNNVTCKIVAQDSDGMEAEANFNQEEGGAGSLAGVGAKEQTAPASLESEPISAKEPTSPSSLDSEKGSAHFHFGI